MKKWMPLLLLASLELQGWGKSMEGVFQQENQEISPIFNLNEKQQWFIENSYLLMKPTLDNLDFANIVTKSSTPISQLDLKTKIKKPDFSWNSGIRLLIGRYLPHHDHWDISADMTYFYGDVTQKMHANPEHGKGITPTYGPVDDFVYVATDQLKGHWDLNYFTWDLNLGREVAISKAIVFHPFISLRALLTYQDYSLKSSRTYQDINQGSHFSSFKFKADNRFWGIGPRVGSHLSFYFSHQWSLVGQLSAAAVYGPYKTHQRESSFTPETGIHPVKTSKDSSAWMRGNLEGSIGLGWEAWLRNNTVRIFPQFLFEGTFWWDMNRYYDRPTMFSESHGALTLMGVSFNLQIDF